MEENQHNYEGQSPAPYPGYQPYAPYSGGYYGGSAPVPENERRAIKRNYSTVFFELLVHNFGSIVLANIIFIAMMLFGYESRYNADDTLIVDIPYNIAASLPSVIFCIGIFLFDKSLGRKKTADYFRSDKISSGAVFAFFGMVMLFYSVGIIAEDIVISGFFAAGYSPIGEEYLTDAELSVPYLIWDLFLTAVLPPIAEELMFRGVVLRRFCTVSQRFGIFASALIFGMMHGNLMQGVMGFFVGLVLGYAAVKTGSLILPAAGHMFINIAAYSCSVAAFLTDEETANAYWICLMGVFFVIGIVTLVILLSKRGISLPRSTDHHRRRTLPIMASCVSFWVVLGVFVIEIVSKFGPVTEKLMS